MPIPDAVRLEAAYQTALAALLAERTPQGHWVGELSTSALSTATAVMAMHLVARRGGVSHEALVNGGLRWLIDHQNADGGWGDTVKSLSNISTTMLCRAAFHLTGRAAKHADVVQRAEGWLAERYGPPESWPEAVRARYGKDRTFAVPILTTCALAGLVSWQEVPSLPFELASLPQSWFRFVRLHVVSYALPALIAIGQAIAHHRPSRNPLVRLVRTLSRKRTLRVLQKIQPSSGGFLEATPLTSFVTLSLASIGQAKHPVALKAIEFLASSARPDGSWAIDSNLATWVTTLSINALAVAGELDALCDKDGLLSWLLKQQFLAPHPYTGAEPGGWAWTDLPGGVPDCDDTPGTLLAVRHLLGPSADEMIEHFIFRAYGPSKLQDLDRATPLWQRQEEGNPAFHVICGLNWVRGLQNRDGGWPTFCCGWGKLPFDRSGSDLTAHALRALGAWVHNSVGTRVIGVLNESLNFGASILSPRMFDQVAQRGFAYLARQQRPDGSWLPLWFGNQHAADDENPTYGTARVLAAYRDLDRMNDEPALKGIAWLLANQNADGGWGGGRGTPSSMEETALAVEVLLDVMTNPQVGEAANNGVRWLVEQVECGGLNSTTPIGFYFARLWYFEKLYPIIFTVAALGHARQKLSSPPGPAARG